MPQHFEKLNHLTETLKSYIYRDAVPLISWQIVDCLQHDKAQPDTDHPQWRILQSGEWWGEHMSWAWLTVETNIPESLHGKTVALHMEFDTLVSTSGSMLWSAPEALVSVQGIDTPQQAINEIHPDIVLVEQATSAKIQITAHVFTGVSLPVNGHHVRIKTAELVWIDRDVEGLYWDARILLDTISVLPDEAPERENYLRTLNDAFQHINWLNAPEHAFLEGVRTARKVLYERIFDQKAIASHLPRPIVHALGHAHIDVAWLWPLRVTRGKAVRTFSTAAALMVQYPAYQFTQSQPHLYQMVAEDDPVLFEQVKMWIASGRWNATGATWVEMDANMPSGESLVRQFLFGMRYFQQTLGVRPEVLWLPDGFGFSAALPQIMRQAGIRYFFTNKLSWNSHTQHPYDTFWWEGLDGSRVLVHLGTTPETLWDVGRARDYTTYVALMTPEEIRGTWTRYKQKAHNQTLMTAYGMGDGGGGPNRDMLERRNRMENLSALPRVIHSSAEAFFHALEANITEDLPRWVGELYLQYHRGTYTTHARTKRFNRKSEVLLHDAEALTSLLYTLSANYPHEALNKAWKTVLLNQFHDILPGSSIRAVHEESEQDYTQMHDAIGALITETLTRLAEYISYHDGYSAFAVFNTLGTSHGGTVEFILPEQGEIDIIDADGQPVPFQWLDEHQRRALLSIDSIPAYGYQVYSIHPASPQIEYPVRAANGDSTRLENEYLRAEFDEIGNLIRLYDIEHGRDILPPDTVGAQLWAYVDRPHEFDAWEIADYAHDQGWRLLPESSRLIESGPVRVTLEVTYRFNRSSIIQHISLTAKQRLLVFETHVDWHEQHILLQARFPLAIRAMNATYEVQFGTLERPTHRNTLWDAARFEVPAQQWVDLSEGGYGVSLLNDSKYGHSAQDHVLTLSLLRSPTHPDPEADQGDNHFTYALYPHTGNWRNGTVNHARRLNHPLYPTMIDNTNVHDTGLLPPVFGFVQCDTAGVIVDTLKKAEDADALIVRIYEAHGGRSAVTLRFALLLDAAEEVNLLEERIGEVEMSDNTIHFYLTPYQVRSFRVTFRS